MPSSQRDEQRKHDACVRDCHAARRRNPASSHAAAASPRGPRGPARRSARAMASRAAREAHGRRPSRSSDAPTSARARSSTASSASGWRSSSDTPGVTRDRLYALDRLARPHASAGRHGRHRSGGRARRRPGARNARASSDCGERSRRRSCSSSTQRPGISPLDDDVVAILRRTRRPVVLVANKAESERVASADSGRIRAPGFRRADRRLGAAR